MIRWLQRRRREEIRRRPFPAAQACILLLHRQTDYFSRLVSILVYPSAYVASGERSLGGGLVSEESDVRLGESWVSGVVVLVWDDVRAGASDIHDGHSVVLHEFAHQLDQETGRADGAPILPRRSMYVAWARVLGHDFDQLVRDTEQRHHTLIDDYGATNPAEFFAVVTETFFEMPRRLRAKYPERYEQRREFYRQDPAVLAESHDGAPPVRTSPAHRSSTADPSSRTSPAERCCTGSGSSP
jgi:MtfA peptidase